ncbi:MAG: galactokinase [Phycisphaerales bacterium]|nr:galactokinase [Phycisphaerales bacterium]
MGPDEFKQRFGRPCEVIARAPGRVNLIGDHTDYNEGFVLPLAVERHTRVFAARRDDARVRVHSSAAGETIEWPIDDWAASQFPHWTSYIAGVASLLRQRGARLNGCDLLIQSDVPLGGGLSSSAALEVAAAKALTCISGEALDSNDVADLCREAEHRFAGVPCGIMDQLASLLSKRDTALLLDCRSRAYEHIPFALVDHIVLIIDSGVRHALAESAYAKRVEECNHAVAHFRGLNAAVRSLRDVSIETVRAQMLQMPPLVAARAHHVVSENRRVQAAAEALRRGDIESLGPHMAASHRSLRDDYEVSCGELDEIVSSLTAMRGVVGCRMTGAGFGGCVVAIVHRAARESIQAGLLRRAGELGKPAWATLETRAGDGATIELA